MEQNPPKPNLVFRLYTPQDYEGLKNIMQISYADLGAPYAPEEELMLLSTLYPRGQIVCLLDGVIVGATISRVVPSEIYNLPHNQATCINIDLYENDTVIGDSVYGLDVFVNPEYQNLRIAKQIIAILMQHIFEDNFKTYMGTSRLVSYPQYMHELSIQEYAAKVKNREIYDFSLSFHMNNKAEFVCENPNFSEDDVKSAGHGVIIAVKNPNFNPDLMIYPDRAKNLAHLRAQKND
jgi:hypothetical protein